MCILYFVGQYDGGSKPMPEYHVKVVGFDPRVKRFFFSWVHVIQNID
jgi:hypothetical protein